MKKINALLCVHLWAVDCCRGERAEVDQCEAVALQIFVEVGLTHGILKAAQVRIHLMRGQGWLVIVVSLQLHNRMQEQSVILIW